MDSIFNKIAVFFKKWRKNKVYKFAVIGPSGAGKTTLLTLLENGYSATSDINEISTTLGLEYRAKKVKMSNFEFSSIDVGGQDFYQKTLWKIAIDQADLVIYLVDGSVTQKNPKFRQAIQTFHYALYLIAENTPILIGINKADLPECMTVEQFYRDFLANSEIVEILKHNPHHICRFSALTGKNVPDALKWVEDLFSPKKKNTQKIPIVDEHATIWKSIN